MSIKIDKKEFFYIFVLGMVLFTAFFPNYFLQISVLNYLRAILNIIFSTGVTLYAIIFKRYNSSLIFIIGYILTEIISTFINGGSISSAIYGQGILLLGLCIAVQIAYERNERLFLKTVYGLFYILVLINYLSIIIFPKGLYYDRHELDGICFLLGNYNGFIIYILFALIPGYIYEMKFKQKLTWKYIVFCLLVIATYLQVHSVTSTVGICLIMAYLVVSRFGWPKHILNLKIYVLINILFFFLIVWNGDRPAVIMAFLALVGKNLTFSGRTMIWQNTRNNLVNHRLLGLGYKSDQEMLQEVGGLSSHNIYLDIIYQTGLVGFGWIIGLFLYACSWIRKIDDKNLTDFLSVCVGVFMLMSQFEASSIRFVFFMLTFISIYSKKHSR